MIIGTAGHVDHGKTALVKALTGVDTDRLAEEKRRGITIDLGYAYAGDLGFIDVPGHERFVHTMLAGASGIDTALLVVALPEGIRPQTREHLQILTLLGIDRVVVALTKADLAADRIPKVSASVSTLLADTLLAGAAIHPVSVVTGQGIEALLAALLASAPRDRDHDGYPRLAVDRAFTLSGAGLIVTGTLVSGRIAVEDRLVLSPSGLDLRVRGLHAQNSPAAEATAGQRVALNITGPRLSKDVVARGDWVLHPDIHAPTAAIDARITLLPDVARALRPDTQAHLHLGAAHVMARVSLLDRDRLEPGQSAAVRLTLQQPIGALAGDRLVLRDTGATATIGGGVVLDPFPPRRGRRTPARLAQLTALEAPGVMEALRGLLAIPPGWTDQGLFMRARGLPAGARAGVIAAVPAMAAGGLILSPAAFDAMRATVLAALAAHHRASPELPGLQAERLRLVMAGRPPVAGFAGVLEALVREGLIAADGPWFRLPGHRISLSPQDDRIWHAARPLIAADRFRPPRVRDIAAALTTPEAAVRATLKRLTRMGRLVEVAPDTFFLRTAVSEMAAIAAEAVDTDGLLTAATFRDRLDNGRKMAILVLEFFDKAGITVRKGDVRRVRTDRLGVFGSPDG
ncbi:selenocysteine-specific translation elongation factor [Acidisphaera sp. S103]|uniref:selenocysteine-specific translation elongation factor n=1 Tax=Acidisphaera sp. S103 TaxID=1747223 RepID=UPI00131DA768|nr:selenocysteine-specific translation elongation factor [Acidisphaera sp. S103]